MNAHNLDMYHFQISAKYKRFPVVVKNEIIQTQL